MRLALTSFGVILFVLLGTWQLQRAEEKAQLAAADSDRRDEPRVDLNAWLVESGRATGSTASQDIDRRQASARGAMRPAPVLLLDNRVLKQQAGYDVFTVMDLENSNTALLVHRGWLAAGPNRASPKVPALPPAPALDGQLVAFPFTGFAMSGTKNTERLNDALLRVQRLDNAELAALLGTSLFALMLRTETPAPGLKANAPIPGFRRERHLGYAVQWFALAAAVIVVAVVTRPRGVAKMA